MKNNEPKSPATGIERVVGLVIWRGRAHPLWCPWPLLVLDSSSWATSLLSRAQDEAGLAHASGDLLTSLDAEQTGAEIEAWLADPQRITHSLPPLALRQHVAPVWVGPAEVDEYVGRLLARSPRTARRDVGFVIDMDQRLLVATQGLRVAVNHCGPAMTGVLVSRAELEDRVAGVLLSGAEKVLGRGRAVRRPSRL